MRLGIKFKVAPCDTPGKGSLSVHPFMGISRVGLDSIPVKHPTVINASCKLKLKLHIQWVQSIFQTPIIYPCVVFFYLWVVLITCRNRPEVLYKQAKVALDSFGVESMKRWSCHLIGYWTATESTHVHTLVKKKTPRTFICKFWNDQMGYR